MIENNRNALQENGRVGDEERFIPTRRTLINRLKDLGDNESWRTFFDTYWKLIYGVAIKAGLSPVDAEEVVQETVISVVRNIGAFRYDPDKCSFKTWLMVVTRSRIANQFRKINRTGAAIQESYSDENTSLLERIPDPKTDQVDVLWDEEWEKNLMDAAIRNVKRDADAVQFQIFDFYVLKEWPVKKVAEAFKVNVAQVYLIKHRISKLIKKEVQKLEARSW